jgi:hypothetical protein
MCLSQLPLNRSQRRFSEGAVFGGAKREMSQAMQKASAIMLVGLFTGVVWAQEPVASQPQDRSSRLAASRVAASQIALPAQRLLMEQVEELAQTGQVEEALRLLEKLFDDAEDRLVPAPRTQAAATLQTQRFIPLARWTSATAAILLRNFPAAAEKFRLEKRDQAQAALLGHKTDKDIISTQRSVQRYLASEVGGPLALLLCDLYLEQGWGIAAVEAAGQISGITQVGLTGEPHSLTVSPATVGSLSAPYAWAQLTDEERAAWLDEWEQQVNTVEGSAAVQQAVEALRRVLFAAAMNPEELDLEATRQWAQALAGRLPSAQADAVVSLVHEIGQWGELPSRSSGVDAFFNPNSVTSIGYTDLGDALWPTWSHSLERYSASSDRTAASRPRVGEMERGALSYFPAIDGKRVFVNEMTQITAYDLESGKRWPDLPMPLPLFDSQISPAAFLPLGYPLIGTPRGTLEIAGDCLYARMGSPVTGKLTPRLPSEQKSSGYIVGLDLSKQGRMLPGFPLHLVASEFLNGEFDGPPVVWGDRLLLPVAERDNVGVRRSVAAFDRITGELLWKSKVLATGTIPGSEGANVISHQMLTIAGGRLYYNTNMGAIACLDPLTGTTQWLVLYASSEQALYFSKPNRFKYRALTPCLVSGGLLYCAPQDTPEIFALDVTTGALAWSTDDWQVADSVHILGVHKDCLLVSGDRLVWLDKRTGGVRGRFPASTTPGLINALPSPRGLGRGAIAGESVFWPTAGEIFVFPACLARGDGEVDAPPIRRRVRLDSRGAEGGNLLFYGPWLFVTSPSRLMAFHIDKSQ